MYVFAENGDEVLVEKGGRVVARLVTNGKREVTLESMRGRLKVVGDIVEPLEADANPSTGRDQGPMHGTVLFMGDVVSPALGPEDLSIDRDPGEDP
jgi:antitoxin (DNA-binding transcriptional repressor) of toxin-antitoxin stability system